MYTATMLIREIGTAEKSMEIAESLGATGGTILRGRGAAAHSEEILNLFDMEIEPEKDILLLITPKEITDQIIDELTEELALEKENSGVIFSFELSDVKGLVY